MTAFKDSSKLLMQLTIIIMDVFIHDAYTLKALELVRLGRSFFITGKAGTGKTTLLKEIVKECRARGKNIAVSAPTGVAAKNAEGQTLHSLLGLKTIVFIPGKIRRWYRTMDDARVKVIKKLDLLIIDNFKDAQTFHLAIGLPF